MPTPITIVAGGDAAVSTTVTAPVADVVNACTSLPFTGTVPLNVSVVTVVVGAVVLVVDEVLLLELLLPHAEASNASASAVAPDRLVTSGAP